MQFCIRHFLVISRESAPFVNAAAAVFLPGDSRLRETANSRPPVDNAKLRQFCIRHFLVISRKSAPSMRRQPYSCRGAPACGKRQIPATVDNAKLRQFCIRHFVFHCDGGVTLTPRKTTFSGDVSLTLNMTVHFVRTPIFGIATLPLFGD